MKYFFKRHWLRYCLSLAGGCSCSLLSPHLIIRDWVRHLSNVGRYALLVSYIIPHTMYLIPCTSYNESHTLYLTPYTLYHALHTMNVIPYIFYYMTYDIISNTLYPVLWYRTDYIYNILLFFDSHYLSTQYIVQYYSQFIYQCIYVFLNLQLYTRSIS